MAITSVTYKGNTDVGNGQLKHVFEATDSVRGLLHVEVTLPRTASDTEVYAAVRARYLQESAAPGTGATIPVGPVNVTVFTPPTVDPLIASRDAWLLTLDRYRALQTLKAIGIFVGTEVLKNGVTVDAQIAAWKTSEVSDLNGLANVAAQLFYLDGVPT
jgi:hypothetical protein